MATTLNADEILTDEMVDRYRETGWLRIDRIITDEELDWLRGVYDDFFDPEGPYAGKGARIKQLGGTDESGRKLSPQVLRPADASEELRNSTYLARLEVLAKLLLGDDASFQRDHMIMKPAGYGTPTPWHQDQAYGGGDRIVRNVNFWLPLEDATVENGCMHFVSGTHRSVIVPHRYLDPDDPQTALVATDQEYWSVNGTAVPIPAGTATAHHSYTMHYATGNTTDRPRRAYIAVFGQSPLERPTTWVLPWLDAARRGS
ncbi:MAG: phytanoyl-CoA dioxygenase family protein [Spirochaetota bacterium]